MVLEDRGRFSVLTDKDTEPSPVFPCLSISPNVFTKKDKDGSGVYVIGYWDTGVGILNYDYICIPSGNEIAIGIAIIAIAALAGWAGVGAGALAPVLA